MTEEEKREKKRNKKKKQRRKKQKAAAMSSDENESESIKTKAAADDESVAPVESDNEVDETFEMELSLFTQKLANFKRLFQYYVPTVPVPIIIPDLTSAVEEPTAKGKKKKKGGSKAVVQNNQEEIQKQMLAAQEQARLQAAEEAKQKSLCRKLKPNVSFDWLSKVRKRLRDQ